MATEVANGRMPGTETSFSSPDPTAVREQLKRVLESPLFKTSKRYPSVLTYLVDRALEGSGEGHLKERTIGVEVLGRVPDYDTNEDPTVRVVAGEIRKRLISYYAEPAHAQEIRIELPLGLYTPRFIAGSPDKPSVTVKPKWRRNILWAMAATICAALLLFVGHRLLPPKTALDRFWGPVVRGAPSVMLCAGEQTAFGSTPTLNDPLTPRTPSPSEAAGVTNNMRGFMSTQPKFSLMTATALTDLASYLRSRTSQELIRAASQTSLTDLRQGPAVLIGSYNNYWTMHFGDNLRFRFRRSNDDGVNWIEDRENPSKKDWAMKLTVPYTDVTEDYAIVTRVADPSTGHIVVSVGGVTPIGTVAAAEFAVSPAEWDAIARQAPRDWEDKNLQVVIEVNVINGNAGSPSVLATNFW